MVKSYRVGSHISQEADLVLEQQLLLSPGLWKGVKFSAEEIIKGINRTNWSNPDINSIIKKHPKTGELPTADDWIGTLRNVRYLTLEDDVEKEGMYADAYLFDEGFAKKVVYGRARLAFSIDSPFRHSRYGATDLTFSRTATVYTAGCDDAYIQLSDSEEDPKMRFISEELNIQLDGEITSESSRGNDGESISNQKVKRVELEDSEIMMTSIDNEHRHAWVSGDTYTSIDNNHRHILDEENMVALEAKGHTHKLTSDVKVQLEYSNNDKKEETKRVMQNKTSNSSVQLDSAPADPVTPVAPATPTDPAAPSNVDVQPVTPVSSDTPVAPATPVTKTEPVVQVAPATPVAPATSVAPVAPATPATPSEPVADNSKELGEMNNKLNGFETKMTDLTSAILKLAEKNNVPVSPVITPVVPAVPAVPAVPVTPVVPAPVLPTEEVKKPALPQSTPLVEDTQDNLEGMSSIEKAHYRLNNSQ